MTAMSIAAAQEVESRTIARQWQWRHMSAQERLAASMAMIGDQPRPALLGMFSWGPANPGHLADDDERDLFAWIRGDGRRAHWLGLDGAWAARLRSEAHGLAHNDVLSVCSLGPCDTACELRLVPLWLPVFPRSDRHDRR